MNAPARLPAKVSDAWQQYTLRGNTEYQLACYDDAIRMHNQALDYARNDFPHRVRFCVDHAIARVLISHFSLADCHSALAEYDSAAECYLQAQRFLLQCSRDMARGERQQQALEHACLHLCALWSEFARLHDHEIPAPCQRAYHEGHAQLQREVSAAVLH
jgi:tetratricopeptide (TPR) repeat protein